MSHMYLFGGLTGSHYRVVYYNPEMEIVYDNSFYSLSFGPIGWDAIAVGLMFSIYA